MKVIIAGSGNTARFLWKRWHNSDEIKIVGLFARVEKKARAIIGEKLTVWTNWEDVRQATADIIMLAVSDDAIIQCASQLQGTQALIVHCSGVFQDSSGLTQGCIWPIYSLAQEDIPLDIPIAFESYSSSNCSSLQHISETLGRSFEVTADKKKMLHLGATIVNNFVHHLLHITSDICHANQIDKSLLVPIINQTTAQFIKDNLSTLQTGAAIRGDQQTMQHHQLLLKQYPPLVRLYQHLSESIINYNKSFKS